MSSLVEQAIQRAFMGFPVGSDPPYGMELLELALERAILGMPSKPLTPPPDYRILLYRPPPVLEK
jgi:hypothetical protein